MRHRVSRLLLVCIVLSLVLHFTVGPLLVWLFGRRQAAQQPQEVVFVTRSTALQIAHRTRPRPAARAMPRPQPRVAHSRPQPVREQQPQPESTPVREIARIDRRAPVPLPAERATQSVDIAEDEQQFEKTIARLRTQNDPVLGAQKPVVHPETVKHYAFDVAAAVGAGPHPEGILEPMPGSPWHKDGYNYYYVRYYVEYADGSTETGIVPWPLRYAPRSDPFRLGLLHIPLPKPLPDYQLPPGTNLQPLVAYCFEHRALLESCPIAHD